MPTSGETLRFGEFELDIAGYALRRHDRVIRLERQPMDLLILLVERRGHLVARAEIVDRLWGKDVFVDVDTGVNTAVRKIRSALRDSPDTPTFIETVAGKGYRFIAPVQVVSSAAEAVPSAPEVVAEAPPPAAPVNLPDAIAADRQSPPVNMRRPAARAWIAVGALAALVAVLAGWLLLGRGDARSTITLAVLPFENLSGDAEREYLADGLTEELIAWLGQIDPERLGVVGRTSAMAYKRSRQSRAEIGGELDADYLVESSIRAEGARVRITSRLIRVRDQVQLWSQSYNREPTSILGLQQELGAAIAEQIRFRLSPERAQAVSRRAPRVAAAYDLYLRGLAFANQRTPATNQQAIEHFRRATTLDPQYAVAWAALAMAEAASAINGDAAPLLVSSRARDAALQGVRADANLAEAQFAFGYLHWMLEWDWPTAETAFRRAIDLDPRFAQAHAVLGHQLSQMGRHAEALPATRRARELDPQDPLIYALSSQVAFQARDYRAALDHAAQAVALDQGFWIGHMMNAQAAEQAGLTEQALEHVALAIRLSGSNSKAVALNGYILGRAGRGEEARAVLATLAAASRTRYVPPYAFALVHAGLRETDAVFAALSRAIDARDVHLIYLPVEPKWDAYRTDPRFEALLTRCGFTGAR